MRTPFTPREVIFAPTAQCNLMCAHCRVDRSRGNGKILSPAAAVSFLEACAHGGVDRVGFSGGEPFLEIEFLEKIIRKTVDLGLYFDRLMTNGDWWKDRAALDAALTSVLDAGFDGTLALSVDSWHGQDPLRIAEFITSAGTIAGRFDMIEIVSVLDRDGSAPLDMLKKVAKALDAKLVVESEMPIAIRNDLARDNRDAGMDDGSGIDISVLVIPYSSALDESAAWKGNRWFADDWCEGPGNVFFVHPDGKVAVCCGFANENEELIAGSIEEGFDALLASAHAKPHIRACYELGLAKYREKLSAQGVIFPGKTVDACFFCDWLCHKGLASRE